MKTQEELKQLKIEIEELSKELKELNEEEIKYVTGGVNPQEHNVMLTD